MKEVQIEEYNVTTDKIRLIIFKIEAGKELTNFERFVACSFLQESIHGIESGRITLEQKTFQQEIEPGQESQ